MSLDSRWLFPSRGAMEWPGDLPHDHAFIELLVPGAAGETDYLQLLQHTEEKLHLNACRWVC